MIEIERKFLVADPSVLDGRTGTLVAQGYLPVEAPSSVRVRLKRTEAGEAAFLTIKHGRNARARLEFEYPVPVADAEEMLEALCGADRVRKVRYEIEHAGHLWEVDRFEEANRPLVLAEIELASEDEAFERPPWLGAEVTEDPRLLNTNLCHRPFAHWPPEERATLLATEPPC